MFTNWYKILKKTPENKSLEDKVNELHRLKRDAASENAKMLIRLIDDAIVNYKRECAEKEEKVKGIILVDENTSSILRDYMPLVFCGKPKYRGFIIYTVKDFYQNQKYCKERINVY